MATLTDRQDVMLKDLLHNLHPESCGGTTEVWVSHARGILVACVGMVQAFKTNLDFEKAMAIVAERAPMVVMKGCCPPSWQEAFGYDESLDPTNDYSVTRTGPCHR